MSDPRHDVVARGLGVAALKTAPPVGVSVWAWTTSGAPTLVALATLIYVIMQSAHLLWKWRKEVRKERADAAALDVLMKGRIARPGQIDPFD